jgi:hypothetical protein
MGIAFFGLGLVIAVGSFAFAILNMTSTSSRNFNTSFRRHGYAMIGFLIGGIFTVIGAAMLGADFISNLVNSVPQ